MSRAEYGIVLLLLCACAALAPMQSEQMNGTPSSEQSRALTHPPDGTLAHYLGVRHAGASALAEPVTAKRVYFYKSGDPQFGGLKVAINNRTFKTFDALLDNLSRRMPLPFGVRTVSTPRGQHAVRDLEQLEDGKAYVCSDRRRAKPLDLEQASRRPQPWRSSRRPLTSSSSRRRALRLLRRQEMGGGAEEPGLARGTPRRFTLVRNGDATGPRYVLPLSRRSASAGLAGLLADASQITGFSVARLYTTDGRKVESLQALMHAPSTLVAAGREPFQPLLYDAVRLPLLQNPRGAARAEGKTINFGALLRKRRVNPQLPSSLGSKRFSVYLDKPSGSGPPQARPRAHSDCGAAENYRHGYATNDSFAFASSTSTLAAPAHALASDQSQASAQSLRQDQTVYQTFPLSAAAAAPAGGREAGGGEGFNVVPMEDDDIEKKVHVNADGSMTVEMRVRFRLHNEVVTWNTRVSRESTARDSGAAAAAGRACDGRASGPAVEFDDLARCRARAGSGRGSAKQAADERLEGPEDYDIWKNPAFRMSPNAFDVGSLNLSRPGSSPFDGETPPPPPTSANDGFTPRQESRPSSAAGLSLREEFLHKVVAFREQHEGGRGALEFHALRRRVVSRSGRVFPSAQRPSTAGARLGDEISASPGQRLDRCREAEASMACAAGDAVMEMCERAENAARIRWASEASVSEESDCAEVKDDVESHGDEPKLAASNCSSNNTYVVTRKDGEVENADDVDGRPRAQSSNSLAEPDADVTPAQGDREDPSACSVANGGGRASDADAGKPRDEERLSSGSSNPETLARHSNSNGVAADVDDTDRSESRSGASPALDEGALTAHDGRDGGDDVLSIRDVDATPAARALSQDAARPNGGSQHDDDDDGGDLAGERSANEGDAETPDARPLAAPRAPPLPPGGRPSASVRKTRLREQADHRAGAARQPRHKPADSGTHGTHAGEEPAAAPGGHRHGTNGVGPVAENGYGEGRARVAADDRVAVANGDESDAERLQRAVAARRDGPHRAAPASLPSTSPHDTIREWLVKISSNPEALEDDLSELATDAQKTRRVNGEAGGDGRPCLVARTDGPPARVECRLREQGIQTEISVIREALQRSTRFTAQSLNVKVKSLEKELHPSDAVKKKEPAHRCDEAKPSPRDGTELVSVQILKNIMKCKDKLMLDQTDPASEVLCNSCTSQHRHRPAAGGERCEQLRSEAFSFLEFLGQLGSLEGDDCPNDKRSMPVQASASEKLLKAWKDIKQLPPEDTTLAERAGNAGDSEKLPSPSRNAEKASHANHVKEAQGDCELPASVVNGIITNGEEADDSETHDGLETSENNHSTLDESFSQGVQNGVSNHHNDHSSVSVVRSSITSSVESTCEENDRHSSEETSSLTSVTSDEEDLKSSDVGTASACGSLPPPGRNPKSDVAGVNWHLITCHTPLYKSPVDTIPEEELSECDEEDARRSECGREGNAVGDRRALPCVVEMSGEAEVRDENEASGSPEENDETGEDADEGAAIAAFMLMNSEDEHSESNRDAPENMFVPEETEDAGVCSTGTAGPVDTDEAEAVTDAGKREKEVTQAAKIVTTQPTAKQGAAVAPAQEEGDFLDRMYTSCGNSCPILTALEAPDARDRNFVYQKPSDPENVWVGMLLKNVGKKCMRHYGDVMREFKIKWDLGENEEVNEMIRAVQAEVSKRIRQSVRSEMKNVEAARPQRAVPRPPLSDASRHSTNSSVSTKMRRMRMESLRRQPTYQDEKTKKFSPVIEELNRKYTEKRAAEAPLNGSTTENETADFENAGVNAGGVDDEVEGEDDDEDDQREYCPCDNCLEKKHKMRRCAKLPIVNAPMTQAFDLKHILREKKDQNVQKNDAKNVRVPSDDNATLSKKFDLKAILKDKVVTQTNKQESERVNTDNDVKALGGKGMPAEAKAAEKSDPVKQEKTKPDHLKENKSNVQRENDPVGIKGKNQAVGVEVSQKTEIRMVLKQDQQRGLWESGLVNKETYKPARQQEGNGLDEGFKRGAGARRKCNMDQVEVRQASVDEGKGSSPDSETVDDDASHFPLRTKLPAIVSAVVVQMATRATARRAAGAELGGRPFREYKPTVTVLRPFGNSYVVARDRAPARAKLPGAAQKLPPIQSNVSTRAVHGSDDHSTLELEDVGDGGRPRGAKAVAGTPAGFGVDGGAVEGLAVLRACGCKCTCERRRNQHKR